MKLAELTAKLTSLRSKCGGQADVLIGGGEPLVRVEAVSIMPGWVIVLDSEPSPAGEEETNG